MDNPVIVLGVEFPAVSFTGVLSSLANILLILMVVFLGKRGFITALVMLMIQLPMIVRGFFVGGNAASLPGIFGNLFTLLPVVAIYRRNVKIRQYRETEVGNLKSQQVFSQRLFEQTATSLVNAIDAKDTYSHGHSLRVAKYSEKIARILGKDDDECYRIYYAALLHDVGKIGIPNQIINKKGKLDKEEFEVIKQHPVKGNQILSSINEYPYLSIGAHYHHERYDGKGYPKGLKGEDIPEIARIISVADAYDAMSSNRSYRDAMPQQIVREEIIKGAGTQFDPKIARIMQQLIDDDPDYKMREQPQTGEFNGKKELICKEFGSEMSEGINISSCITTIRMFSRPNGQGSSGSGMPSMILFDSLDGRVHSDEGTAKDLNYYEYCTIRMDGRVENPGARKVEANVYADPSDESPDPALYEIEAVKYKDHALVKIQNNGQITEITVALPDSSRFLFIGLTGEYCDITDVEINTSEEAVGPDYITRIAEEISYIEGPTGDIPNVQIDGYRADASVGIPLKGSFKIRYHTKSLPTARLIWHCAYLVVFHSKDGTVNGEDYREYALIRTDGEGWESGDISEVRLTVNKQDDFNGWEAWKEGNRKGLECMVLVEKRDDKVIVTTDNMGILIRNTTTILDGTEDLYIALTGDQGAITNIRIE